MPNDPNLQFIKEKIYNVRTAIMYSMSSEVVKIPNSIVSIKDVDNEGHLWFKCDRPSFSIEESDVCFPARLYFHKKGMSFQLEVSGKAQVIDEDDDPVMVNARGQLEKKQLLIRMNMTNVSFTDKETKRGTLDVWLDKGIKWFNNYIPSSRSSKPAIHH